MRTLRSLWLVKLTIFFMTLSLVWLEMSPTYAMAAQVSHRQAAWIAHMQALNALPNGWTQTPDAALQKKILARQIAAREAAKHAIPDVRPLSAKEMGMAHGRGPLRSPYFNGTLPWQRSFHDVNLCNGNLFKSFTDIQVAPARGAGLILQRTYNSNEATAGPFGVGWTHAYDITIQEAADVASDAGNTSIDTKVNDVPRADFFGAMHTYHRDADGLYSPPPYLYDELSSDYNKFLVGHPTSVISDTDKGMDGTIKHYTTIDTYADGTTTRACDYIQDRYGNTTNLTYGQSYNYTRSDGSTGTHKLLTLVTDPVGRTLTFHWTNLGTTAQPAYRITEIDAPTDPATGTFVYRVTYDYYTDTSDPNAANDLYNLKAVHLDPDGLNRTTTYTYTSCTGTYTNSGGTTQSATENGLLASITDPLGHVVSYQYSTTYVNPVGNSTASQTGTVWVSHITEPAGVDTSNNPRTITWTIAWTAVVSSPSFPLPVFTVQVVSPPTSPAGYLPLDGDINVYIYVDQYLRTYGTGVDLGRTGGWPLYSSTYDTSNNVLTSSSPHLQRPSYSVGPYNSVRTDTMTYGQHGNLLTDAITGFTGQLNSAYYNASQYFQKQSDTDFDGHTTMNGVGTSTAGNPDDPDTNPGDRGNVLWVQDAGYNDSGNPSYHKQYAYTYNQYGQKLTETNLNGVVTHYYYKGDGSAFDGLSTASDVMGDLIAVVQDPGDSLHLSRTTMMHYDIMGRVLQSTDPKGQQTTTTYNSLGQPVTVKSYSDAGITLKETISYTYDANGRTATVTDSRGTTSIAYEAGSDRVSSVTDPVTGTIGYAYRLTGERSKMTLPGGQTWTYNYKSAAYSSSEPLNPGASGSRATVYVNMCVLPKDDPSSVQMSLSSIIDDKGRIVFYNLFLTGELQEATTNVSYNSSGSVVGYCATEYQDDGGLTSVPTHGWLSEIKTTYHWTDSSGSHSKILNQNDYTYDTAGLRLSNTIGVQTLNGSGYGVVDGSGNPVMQSNTEQYTYDDLNRLSTVDYGGDANGDTGADETQSYTFDAMGNRLGMTDTISGAPSGNGTTTHSYVVDNANRLTNVDGNAYTNDADGNTLTGGGRTNTWDSENRLVSCIDGSNTSTYTYGADGLRRSSTVTPTNGTAITTNYVLDNSMLVQELRGNNTWATYFVGARGPECRIDETSTSETAYTSTAGQSVQRGPTKWYIYDGLGSVVGEIDPLGNVTASKKFDVYGATRTTTGTSTTRQGFVGSLGHQTDMETGFIYMRARYYDPTLGRFASEDSNGGGTNQFIYCGANPVNTVDQSGHNETPTQEQADFICYGEGAGFVFLTLAFYSAITNNLEKALAYNAAAMIAFEIAQVGIDGWKGDHAEGEAEVFHIVFVHATEIADIALALTADEKLAEETKGSVLGASLALTVIYIAQLAAATMSVGETNTAGDTI